MTAVDLGHDVGTVITCLAAGSALFAAMLAGCSTRQQRAAWCEKCRGWRP